MRSSQSPIIDAFRIVRLFAVGQKKWCLFDCALSSHKGSIYCLRWNHWYALSFDILCGMCPLRIQKSISVTYTDEYIMIEDVLVRGSIALTISLMMQQSWDDRMNEDTFDLIQKGGFFTENDETMSLRNYKAKCNHCERRTRSGFVCGQCDPAVRDTECISGTSVHILGSGNSFGYMER